MVELGQSMVRYAFHGIPLSNCAKQRREITRFVFLTIISRWARNSSYRSAILYLDFKSARPCILCNESERGQWQNTDSQPRKV